MRSIIVQSSIEFCTWQSNLTRSWVVNSTLVFSYEREREKVCFSAVVFFCYLLLIKILSLSLSLFLWCFDPEEGFIWWFVHFSVLRQKNLMNEAVPARSALSCCTEQQGIVSHLPWQLFVVLLWRVHLCLFFFFFTQHGDWFALKMEIIYIRLLHSLSKASALPFLKRTRVLLPVTCPHSDLGRTITITLVFLYVGLQNVNG